MGKNVLVGLSGGPSSAINASLAGVIKQAADSSEFETVYGAVNGIQGVLDRNIIDITGYSDEKSLRLLCQTPAMALGSCRKKLVAEEFADIERLFAEYNIDTFFYIGGNDSMDTVLKLSEHFEKINSSVKVVGVPKTIDNDLPATDHTPGYGSSAKYLYHTMTELIRDSLIYPVKSVVIVEVMGRDSGWLTLAAALPAFLKKDGLDLPQIVAIPETAFDQAEFLNKIRFLHDTQRSVICVVSEGIRDENQNYVGMAAKSGAVDTFGHVYLSGVGKYLEGLVARHIGCKVRSVELNVMQRCSAHLASKTDIQEAFGAGKAAVDAALGGKTGVMITLNRVSQNPYKIEYGSVGVAEVANKARLVPKRWFDLSDGQVQREIIEYILPLIRGDLEYIKDENELPEFLTLY